MAVEDKGDAVFIHPEVATEPHFEMEVWPGGVAQCALAGERLCGKDGIAQIDMYEVRVTVDGSPGAVIEHDG